MPSSNVRDDLPSHYGNGWLLRQLAAVVIYGAGARRTGVAPRSSRVVKDPVPAPVVGASRVEESQADNPRALPASPSRTTAEAHVHAEEFRERLRRGR